MLSNRFFVKTLVSVLSCQETGKPINQNICNAFQQILSKRLSLYFLAWERASLSTRIHKMLSENFCCHNVCFYTDILFCQEICKPINQNRYNAFQVSLSRRLPLYCHTFRQVTCKPVNQNIYYVFLEMFSQNVCLNTAIPSCQVTCKPINENIYNAFEDFLCQNICLYTAIHPCQETSKLNN